jgi:hypothetical protein
MLTATHAGRMTIAIVIKIVIDIDSATKDNTNCIFRVENEFVYQKHLEYIKTMSAMEICALERFTDLSEAIQVDYPVARSGTPKFFKQLEPSSLRVSKYLSGVAELCVCDEAKSLCVQPARIVTQLTQKLEAISSRLKAHETSYGTPMILNCCKRH